MISSCKWPIIYKQRNLQKGDILYFSLKVCKKKKLEVRKKSGSAFHCLAEKYDKEL